MRRGRPTRPCQACRSPEPSWSASGVARARTHSALHPAATWFLSPCQTCPFLGQYVWALLSFQNSVVYYVPWACFRTRWKINKNLIQLTDVYVSSTKNYISKCRTIFWSKSLYIHLHNICVFVKFHDFFLYDLYETEKIYLVKTIIFSSAFCLFAHITL
jgi:hypothetical protein